MPTGMRKSTMTVHVVLLSGKEYRISCRRRDRVTELKEKLAKEEGFLLWAQRLFDSSGKELTDKDILAKVGVRHNDFLNLVYNDDDDDDHQPPPLCSSSDSDARPATPPLSDDDDSDGTAAAQELVGLSSCRVVSEYFDQ